MDVARFVSDADTSLDMPGILWFEHVNIVLGDRALTDLFFFDLLGCTPDPSPSYHANLGAQQFHLGIGDSPMNFPGTIGLALPSLDSLRSRLAALAPRFAGTKFSVEDGGEHIALSCPWYYTTRHSCVAERMMTPSVLQGVIGSVASAAHLLQLLTLRCPQWCRGTSTWTI